MKREIALHCMKAASQLESELCEECPIYGETGSDHCFEDALQYVIGMLEQEPKTGHWIDDADKIDAQYGRHMYRCQICDEYADYFVGGTEDWWHIKKPNFCPNCGAKMESEG